MPAFTLGVLPAVMAWKRMPTADPPEIIREVTAFTFLNLRLGLPETDATSEPAA